MWAGSSVLEKKSVVNFTCQMLQEDIYYGPVSCKQHIHGLMINDTSDAQPDCTVHYLKC